MVTVVSVANWWLGRRRQAGLSAAELAVYMPAQVVGAVAGSVLANLMFGLPAIELSTKDPSGVPPWLGEVVAAAGLVLLVFALA
jgi:glycerol uptake facilitator-like aquaporin